MRIFLYAAIRSSLNLQHDVMRDDNVDNVGDVGEEIIYSQHDVMRDDNIVDDVGDIIVTCSHSREGDRSLRNRYR